jgi:hypothetical protein
MDLKQLVKEKSQAEGLLRSKIKSDLAELTMKKVRTIESWYIRPELIGGEDIEKILAYFGIDAEVEELAQTN